MAIQRYNENNWDEIRKGVFRKIVYLEDIMTVLVEFRNGPWNEADPFHSHPHEQTTYVAKGEIILSCEGEPDHQLAEGDMFYIPSRKKHTIRVMSTLVRLVDNFSPIREEFI
jgi:quercetin dioxygenase-like cupin family protein